MSGNPADRSRIEPDSADPHLVVRRPRAQQPPARRLPHKCRPRCSSRGAPRAVWRGGHASQWLGRKAALVRLVLVPRPKVQPTASPQLRRNQVVATQAGQPVGRAGAGLERGEGGARLQVPAKEDGRGVAAAGGGGRGRAVSIAPRGEQAHIGMSAEHVDNAARAVQGPRHAATVAMHGAPPRGLTKR